MQINFNSYPDLDPLPTVVLRDSDDAIVTIDGETELEASNVDTDYYRLTIDLDDLPIGYYRAAVFDGDSDQIGSFAVKVVDDVLAVVGDSLSALLNETGGLTEAQDETLTSIASKFTGIDKLIQWLRQ